MTLDEEILLISQIEQVAIHIRGNIMHRAVSLEMMIDAYISFHFVDDADKSMELASLLLIPRITFDNKKQIFSFLIEKHNAAFKADCPKYLAMLDEIILYRNACAHFPVADFERAIELFKNERKIIFIKFKGKKPDKGETQFPLSTDLIVSLDDINRVLSSMLEIVTTLKKYLPDFSELIESRE